MSILFLILYSFYLYEYNLTQLYIQNLRDLFAYATKTLQITRKDALNQSQGYINGGKPPPLTLIFLCANRHISDVKGKDNITLNLLITLYILAHRTAHLYHPSHQN